MTDPDPRDPRLDQAYAATPRDAPPRELDERIRAAARRAVGAGPQSLETHAERQRTWATRSRVPLSVAAMLVIAATLTLMVQEEERQPRDETPARAPAPAAPSAAEPSLPARAPAPEVRRSVPAPSEAATAVPEPKRTAPVAPAARQRGPAADAAPPSPPPLEIRQERAAERVPVAPAPVPAAPPGPRAAPATRDDARARVVPQAAPAGNLSPPVSRDRALGERPERSAREAAAPTVRPPEQWIEDIRRLKAQGRDAEAGAELAEFRRRYPDYTLPADLSR